MIGGELWLVSEYGNDSLTCGLTAAEPCFTLSWVLNRYHNTTDSSGELIRITTDKTLQIDGPLLVSITIRDRD